MAGVASDAIAVPTRGDPLPSYEQGTTLVAGRSVPARVLDRVLSTPSVRAAAVARGRALLASPAWCRADEVAAALLDCYVTRRLP